MLVAAGANVDAQAKFGIGNVADRSPTPYEVCMNKHSRDICEALDPMPSATLDDTSVKIARAKKTSKAKVKARGAQTQKDEM